VCPTNPERDLVEYYYKEEKVNREPDTRTETCHFGSSDTIIISTFIKNYPHNE